MNNKTMIFSFPITDFTATPGIHLTDLVVTADVQIRREVKTLIKNIRYTEAGTDNSCKVLPLLKVIAPALVEQIKAAAQAKAVDEFENLCIKQFN